jgi:hypothetical protein
MVTNADRMQRFASNEHEVVFSRQGLVRNRSSSLATTTHV